jgi:uncharacterized protein
MTLRVVFDTSTLVSAALQPDSVPDRALGRALLSYQVIACRETLDELQRVLQRSKFDRYISSDSRSLFFQKFRRDCFSYPLAEVEIHAARGVCRDDKDTQFLALALVAKAELIVSSDQDLLVLDAWRGIEIRTPAQFLEQSKE